MMGRGVANQRIHETGSRVLFGFYVNWEPERTHGLGRDGADTGEARGTEKRRGATPERLVQALHSGWRREGEGLQ
jgi:hypothetical protein